MAISKTITANGSKGHHTFSLKVEETSTSTANNTSTVKFTFSISPVQAGWDWAANGVSYSVDISGTKYNGTIPTYDGRSTVTLKTGSKTITHNQDGKKIINISFSVTDSTTHNYTSGNAKASSSLELSTILRNAKVTSAPNLTDKDTIATIQFSNPAGFGVEFCISLDGSKSDIPYSSQSKSTSGSHTFTLTSADIQKLKAATNASSRSIRFYARTTYPDNTKHLEYISKTFTVTESEDTKPTLTIKRIKPNSSLGEPFDNLYIQNKTGVEVEYEATADTGATIKNFNTNVTGVAAQAGNPCVISKITKSGNVDVVGTVQDSRGFTNSVATGITVYPYENVSIAPYNGGSKVECYRCDNNGDRDDSGQNIRITGKRVYSDVNGSNHCEVTYKFKTTESETYSGPYIIISKDSTINDFDLIVREKTFYKENSYDILLQASDDLGSTFQMQFTIPTDKVVLHLPEGGNGLGIGMYCKKENCLQIDYDVEIKGKTLEQFIKDVVGIK